jgi:hypothetical protein
VNKKTNRISSREKCFSTFFEAFFNFFIFLCEKEATGRACQDGGPAGHADHQSPQKGAAWQPVASRFSQRQLKRKEGEPLLLTKETPPSLRVAIEAAARHAP